MLPVCSATSSSCHSLISVQGGLHLSSSSRFCNVEDGVVRSLTNGTHNCSLKTQATKSLYSTSVGNIQSVSLSGYSCPGEFEDVNCKVSNVWDSSDAVVNMGSIELKYVDDSSMTLVEEGITDFPGQMTDNTENLMVTVEPELPPTDLITENSTSASSPMDLGNDSVSNIKSSFDKFFAEVSDTFSASINKGEVALKSSVDNVTSSITSIKKAASDLVDSAVSRAFSTVDQTGDVTGDNFSNFSSDLKETSNRATVAAVDVLRKAIVALEDSISSGFSFVVYSYNNSKDLLPPEVKNALNLSEEKAVEILKPVGSAFQQVSAAIEGLERSLGLNTSDPIVPFALFLGTSATLWVFFWVRTYGGYSGDLSPESTLELLNGKENAVLIDVRPEVLRERDGIPDLRRSARFRYASLYLPEVNGSVRKLLRSEREADDAIIAAVIRNLKIVQDRSKVIVMDSDGSRSKGIARSLRKLGIQRPYLVQGGFQSWVKQGSRIKELRPETALTILNEDAEAILEDIKPSPLQVLGYGVGVVAAFYAVLEWEYTLQLIGVVGLGQTIYRRVTSYEDVKDLRKDVRLLLTPVRVGANAFSWAAGKLETNGFRLPTSPSSTDVQSRVLQAAAKHESQSSETEGNTEPLAPMSEGVDLSEA